MGRSYLALALVAAILVSAVVVCSYAESGVVPASVQSWFWRRPVAVRVYASLYGAELLIGAKPFARLSIPWFSFMNPDFSDVRFASGSALMQQRFVSVSSGSSATVDVELPAGASGTYTLHMYYGNPSADRFSVDLPDIGFVWRYGDVEGVWPPIGPLPDTTGLNGASAAGFTRAVLVTLWVYASRPTIFRVYIAKSLASSNTYVSSATVGLYTGRLGMLLVDGSTTDFYDWVKQCCRIASVDVTYSDVAEVNAPSAGWYTISLRAYLTGNPYGYFTIYRVEDIVSGWVFGNAVSLVKIDRYRFLQVPVVWDSRYYSYDIGGEEPVSYVAPARPTVVWNATVGNVYYEYLVYPRTVTVAVPLFTTVVRNITVTLPPSSTLTTTVYIPVTTVTTYVPVEPTTITKTVTVAEPRFTATTYTTTVTRTVTKPVTETVAVTTASPVATTTTVNGTPTTTTTYVTTTTVVTRTYYTTVTEASPWRITRIVPTATETKTITTTVPVTTTIYAAVTVPVYYTTTVTLVNNNTSTVTTTVPITAAVDSAAGEYAVMQPLVLGPYGGATTVYWVVKSAATETVTTTAVAGVPVEYGLAILVAMLAVIGIAMYILLRRARH
jgi:hypothetical protein